MMVIRDILECVEFLDFIGDRNQVVKRFIVLDPENSDRDAIFWCSDNNINLLNQSLVGTVICSPNAVKSELSAMCNYIIVESPRAVFAAVIKLFDTDASRTGVAQSACISPDAVIGANVTIGEGVVVEANCEIGNNVSVDHNTVIKRNTRIGDDVLIGSNCTIGGCGFGYEVSPEGRKVRISHIGGVVIEACSEIGNNVCIDRGVIDDTKIGHGVLIDNLAHISHNVVVGEEAMIYALTVTCGSTVIGGRSRVAPGSSIINKITIGKDVQIGMGAVVTKDVDHGSTVVGNPARKIK